MVERIGKVFFTAGVALMLALCPVAAARQHESHSQETAGKKKPTKAEPKEKAKSSQEAKKPDQHVHPGGTASKSQQEPAKPGPPEMKMEMNPPAGQAPSSQQQTPPKPPDPMQGMEHMQHMGRMAVVKPEFPRLGKSQENPPAPLIQLNELEQMAMGNNPTLAQAEAEIRASKARQLQSGLYPNPRAGYTGEEIRGGSFGGGQQGFFVSQTLVTAGKLGRNRKITGQDVRISEIEKEEQRLRVMNAVRLAYYRVLAAQEMLDTKKDLLGIAEETLKTAQQLRNTGQADEPEVLQAEVEQQQLEMDVEMQENTLRQEWRSLAAVVGNPSLEMRTVVGNLEKDFPELDEQQVIQTLVTASPAVRIADALVNRAQATLARERREPVPDIEVRAGLQRNGELLEPSRRRVGLQGFAEIGVQLPIFNRNQGNIQAARHQIDRAQQEQKRVELALRDRSAAFLEMYHNSRIMVERYRTQLLPRAQKAYELMFQKYGLMLASYPQVLIAQRTLFHMQREYIAALEGLWANGITLRGLLLTDGLEAPARPGEVDMPVRELNVPVRRPGTPER